MGKLTPQAKGHIAMLFFSAFVAGSFSLGNMIANEIEPLAVTTFRFGAGALILGLLAMMQGGFTRAAFAAPWRYMLLGNLFAVYFVLMFAGLQTSTPVAASAMFTLIPLITAVFAWFLLRQVTSFWSSLALLIGAAGALMVIFRADLNAMLAFEIGHGEMIYFFGCISHALYTPMLRRLNRGESAVVFTFGMQIAGFGALLIYSYGIMQAIDWMGLSNQTWAILAYLSVFSTAISFVLLQYATIRLAASKVMAYTYLTPTWVIGWEMAMGNDLPPDVVYVGIALTIVALIMLLRTDKAMSIPHAEDARRQQEADELEAFLKAIAAVDIEDNAQETGGGFETREGRKGKIIIEKADASAATKEDVNTPALRVAVDNDKPEHGEADESAGKEPEVVPSEPLILTDPVKTKTKDPNRADPAPHVAPVETTQEEPAVADNLNDDPSSVVHPLPVKDTERQASAPPTAAEKKEEEVLEDLKRRLLG